jgi:TP901 family phage tail tape measure protein
MDREVRIAFIAKTATFVRDLQSLASKVQEVQGKISKLFDPIVNVAKNIGRTMIGFSSTLGAGLGLASKSAMEFDVNMRNVNSILGASPAQFQKLEQQILHLSGTVPKAANDLAQASYQIVSSGFTNAADLNLILAASAKAATAGLTSTGTAATAITTVLQAYGLGADKAAHVSDALFQTVNVGMVNFEQLTNQIGDFMGISQSLGVSMEESLGLYANITLATGQYAQSSTDLTGILRGFLAPSAAMKEALLKIGGGTKTATELIKEGGLTKLLYQMADGVNNDATALHELFPNVEGLRGVLAATRKPLEDTNKGLAAFLDPMKLNGATAKVFNEQMKAVGNQLSQLHTAFGAAAISIGTALLPFSFIVKGITSLVSTFNDLPDPIKQATGLLLGLAAVLGTIGGFVIVFRAKALLMTLAMEILNVHTKGLIATGIQFGREFTGKAKILEMGALGASKMTGAVNKLGAEAIPGATAALARLGARIPVVGASIADVTTKLGTGLGTAMTKVTTVSGGMSSGFERIGNIISFSARAITGTQNAIVKTIQVLPKLAMAAGTAFATFETLKAIEGMVHNTELAVSRLTKAMADAGKTDVLPKNLNISKLATDFHQAGLEAWGATKGLQGIADMGSHILGSWSAGKSTEARDNIKKTAAALKGLQALDPIAAAKEYDMLRQQLLGLGVAGKTIDIAFKDYITAATAAGVATAAMTPKLNEADQAAQDLTKHTMALTAAQDALKAGFGTWGDLSGAMSKATSSRSQLTAATTKDTTAEKANLKAHEQWVKGADARDVAVQQAAIGVIKATDAVAAAQKNLDEVRANTGYALRLATAEMSLQAAYRGSAGAEQHVIDLTEQLNNLRHPPARTIQEAEDALTTAQNAQADSLVALTFAQDKLAFARQQGTPKEIAQSERDLTNAQIDQRAKINAVTDAQAALNTIRAGGDPKVIAQAERDLADAKDASTTATQGIADAQKNLTDIQKEDQNKAVTDAALALKEAQLGLRTATDGVATANAALIEQLPTVTSAVNTFGQKTNDAKASAKEFSDQLKRDQIDQNDWLTNLNRIATIGPPGLATALQKLGIDGMQVVKDLKNKSPSELQTMFDTMNANAITKTGEWAVWVEAGFKDGKGRAEVVTQQMVDNIAFQLGITADQAKKIMSSYLGVISAVASAAGSGATVAVSTSRGPSGPGGIVSGPGGQIISINPPGTPAPTYNLPAFGVPKAAGGIDLPHVAQVARTMRVWAEPETGGEAYIPLAAAKRQNSVAILSQVARMFGMRLSQMADGGMIPATRQIVSVGGSHGLNPISVSMPIHIEARVAAGVDMDYASRVISQKVEAGVKMALENLNRQVIVKAWRN